MKTHKITDPRGPGNMNHISDEVYDLDVANAPLPQVYENAKRALSQCSSVDECKNWTDKAQALASYAKQADDDTLFKYAKRIQARAVRRSGELLKQFDARGDHRKSEGTHTFSQAEVAEKAGLSKHQQTTAVRVANVGEKEFNKSVDSEEPPTITALADKGKKLTKQQQSAKEYLESEKPQGFKESIHFSGALDRILSATEGKEELIVSGLSDNESASVKQKIKRLDRCIDKIFINL